MLKQSSKGEIKMRFPSGQERLDGEYGRQGRLRTHETRQEAEEEGRSEIVIKSIFSLFLLPFRLMLLTVKLMFFIGGWGMILTGYCAVLGTGLVGLLGLWSGAAHPASGLGASLFGFGCGFFALGLASVAWMLTDAAASGFIRMAAGRSRAFGGPGGRATPERRSRWNRKSAMRTQTKLAALLLGAGLVAGVLGIAAGGYEKIELPAIPFLQSVEFRFGEMS